MKAHIAFFLALIVMVPQVGCRQEGADNRVLPLPLKIQVSPENPKYGQTVVLSLPSPTEYSNHHWQLSSPTGSTRDEASSGFTFVMDEVGEYRVSLEVVHNDTDLVKADIELTSVIATSTVNPLHFIADIKQGSTLVGTVASDGTGSGFTNVDIGDVTLDFSRSFSDSSGTPSKFSFEVNWGNGLEAVTNPVTHSFPTSHVYPIGLKMSDDHGNVLTQSFNLYVRCPASQIASRPALSADLADDAVSAADGLNNVFNYQPKNITGGVAPYLVRWDLDGDGVLDTGWVSASDAAGSPKPTKGYSRFVGPRALTMQVMDSCFTTVVTKKTVTIPVYEPFLLSQTAQSLTDAPTNYYYVDAQMGSATYAGTPSSNPANNGHYLVTAARQGGQETSRYISAGYGKYDFGVDPDPANYRAGDRANFAVDAMDPIDNNGLIPFAGILPNSRHGMYIEIGGLHDPVGMVSDPQMPLLQPDAYVRKVAWYTDTRGDVQTSQGQYTGGDCQVSNVKTQIILPAASVGKTCADIGDDENINYTVIFSGNFSCTNMTWAWHQLEVLNINPPPGPSGSFFAISGANACDRARCPKGVKCYQGPL